MTSHAERAGRMEEGLKLSGDEIRKRKSFLGLSGEEEISINLILPLFQNPVPAFVALLHQRIGRSPKTARIPEKTHSQSWPCSRQAEYFIELVSAPYAIGYVHNPLPIGISHQEIGLGPEKVRASFGLFLKWANRTFLEELDFPLSAKSRLVDSLSEITMSDSALVPDSYFMAENEPNEVLSRIFETIAEVVWILDGNWPLLHANKTSEKVIGWDPSDLVANSFEDILVKCPTAFNLEKERLVEVTAREGPWEGELLLIHRNGSEISFWVPLHLLDEIPESVTILEFRDRTAEKQTTERERLQKTNDLLRSNRDIEQFVYVASHDLWENLRMVTRYTQLLARRYEGKTLRGSRPAYPVCGLGCDSHAYTD